MSDRVNLYKLLPPKIQEEDQKAGVFSQVRFWDDKLNKWDDGGVWDKTGLLPVIKNLFWAIEEQEEKDLISIDGLADLTNPDKCPESFLGYMSRSLGMSIDDSLPLAEKRELVKGIIQLYKIRGKPVSWQIYFRTIGLKTKATPLYKKDLHETSNYSQKRYVTSSIDAAIGSAGSTYYSGTLDSPIEPNTLLFFVNGKVLRDDGNYLSDNFGKIIGTIGGGSINYAIGKYELVLTELATTSVEVRYNKIVDEYPYQAARVNLEVFIFPDIDNQFSFVVDENFIKKVLSRLEEVRPIHVLVWLTIVVMIVPEIINNAATDDYPLPNAMAKDVRETETRFYCFDGVFSNEVESMLITKDFALSSEKDMMLEDRVPLVPVPDTLRIEYNGNTEYF